MRRSKSVSKEKTVTKLKLTVDQAKDARVNPSIPKGKTRSSTDSKAMNDGTTVIDDNAEQVTSKNQKLDLPEIEENKEYDMCKSENQSAATTSKTNISKKKKSTKRKGPQHPAGQKKKTKKVRARRKTKMEKINDQLKAIGIDFDEYEKIGNCARAAIYNGFIKLTGNVSDLDQVVISGRLPICEHQCSATLRSLLRQPDYAGLDYEDGLQNATVFCDQNTEANNYEECDEGRTYVTRMCSGKPQFDDGKFHNHCVDCKNFGKCIGDYREMHCGMCGKHYFSGLSGYPCPCEERRGGRNGDCCIQ